MKENCAVMAGEHPFDRVIAALRARGSTVRFTTPDQVRATCPSHPDAKPSLSVKRIERGVLMHCHGSCPKGAPARALGFRPHELSIGERPPRTRAEIVATYDYSDSDGVLLAQKVRSASKNFWWRRPEPEARGGWRFGLGGLGLPGLYRRPQLAGASIVFLVEGEKAVDTLNDLNLIATCGPAGAGTWRSNWSEDLLKAASAHVVIVILPDNDFVGQRHAELLAAGIYQRDSMIDVRVVSLPELPKGGDVVDWLEVGNTSADLLALVSSTTKWSPGAVERQRLQRRKEQAKHRMRKLRAKRRGVEDLDSTAITADRDAEALGAIGAVLDEAGEPCSWRCIWRALKGGPHPRTTIERALKLGVDRGDLVLEPGPRRAHHYRRSLAPSGIRGVTQPGHSAQVQSVTGVGQSRTVPKNDSAVEPHPGCASEEIAVSERPVTPFAVTQVNASIELQENLQEDRATRVTGVGTLGRPTTATKGWTAPGSVVEAPEASAGETHKVVSTERQADIEAGHCRGCTIPGEFPWCRICRWSPTYWRRVETTTLDADLSCLRPLLRRR